MTNEDLKLTIASFVISVVIIFAYFAGRMRGFEDGVAMMQQFLDRANSSQDEYFNKWLICTSKLIDLRSKQ